MGLATLVACGDPDAGQLPSEPEALPGSDVLLAALDSTVFQFPAIQEVEYRLDGSCEAFWEWLQRECAGVTRP